MPESVGRPIVYACVLREEQKQAGGVVGAGGAD